MLMVWVLGPMAVVPESQRQGIGTKLIEYSSPRNSQHERNETNTSYLHVS